jgi:HemK-related putative methylase
VFPIFDDENLLLSKVLKRIEGRLVLDIGTGSGILAISAANGGARVHAVDINERALVFAKENVRVNNVEERVKLFHSDLLPPNASRYDVIVSNPPFVPNPGRGIFHLAGDGGVFGTSLIHRILASAPQVLTTDGILLMTALSLCRRGLTYVEELVHRAMPSAHCYIQRIYPTTYPLATFMRLFRHCKGWKEWRSVLYQASFESLVYVLVIVSFRPLSTSGLLVPLIRRAKYSGSWRARIRRYRMWLALRRTGEQRSLAKL